MLIRIVYASQVCPHIRQKDIGELVEWSQRFNQQHF
jgi:hypothetical protein